MKCIRSNLKHKKKKLLLIKCHLKNNFTFDLLL